MTSRTTILTTLIAGTLFVASPIAADQAIAGQVVQGAPARDLRAPAPTGTAVIRGRIVAADTGRPLRRARISVSAPELGGQGRTTSTSAEGRFEIRDLPAGRYSISVSRSGYLNLRYGQRRPLEQGKPIQIVDKQVVEGIDFALPRMSLITGRVTDEVGEPIADVNVYAMRSMYFEGRRRLTPVDAGGTQTDDAGQYRLFGLTPGSYYVVAQIRESWTVTENGVERVMGYAPTYFPGLSDVALARRVTVGVGQEASATDFSLVPGRAANISGTAMDSLGRPLAGQRVSLAQEMRSANSMSSFGSGTVTVAADGSFAIKDVAPGEYKLSANATLDGRLPNQLINGAPAGGWQEGARQTVTIDGVDIANLLLVTSAGWSAAGQVVTDDGTVPTVQRDRVIMSARALDLDVQPRPNYAAGPDNGRVREDWSFAVGGIVGAARLRATVPDGWMLKAILRDSRDVTDTLLEMKGGESLSGLQVVLTNRINSLSGQLFDEKGAPSVDGTIIVFAADSEKWSEGSRWVRSARPDQQGQYQIRALPAGEYLAIAVEYVEEGMWNDPEYLESIRRYGQRLTVAETGSQSVALKVVAP